MSITNDPYQDEWIAAFPAPPGRMTEAEFLAWCPEDVRAEWVDGEVIVMSPASPDHMDLSLWLGAIIRAYVEVKDLGQVRIETWTRLARQRQLRAPDLWFVTKERAAMIGRTYLDSAPDMALEIISPDSEARDRQQKFAAYQAAKIPEYWVLDPLSSQADVFLLIDGVYERLAEVGGWLESRVIAGLRLRTDWFWAPNRPRLVDALRDLALL